MVLLLHSGSTCLQEQQIACSFDWKNINLAPIELENNFILTVVVKFSPPRPFHRSNFFISPRAWWRSTCPTFLSQTDGGGLNLTTTVICGFIPNVEFTLLLKKWKMSFPCGTHDRILTLWPINLYRIRFATFFFNSDVSRHWLTHKRKKWIRYLYLYILVFLFICESEFVPQSLTGLRG